MKQKPIQELQADKKRLLSCNARFAEKHGLFDASTATRFAFIQQQRKAWPVALLCRVLKVSTSGFYEWEQAGPRKQERAAEERRLAVTMEQLFDASQGTWGSRRLSRELRASGQSVGRHKTTRLMKQYGLVVRNSKKTRSS